jgi:uncharacterized glyoxalase superfamily protein PhnB
MATLTSSAPVLLVSDVRAAAAYYADKLGFTDCQFYGDPTNFCIARRDNLAVMLALADPADIVPHWKIVGSLWNVYFWVDDADALYAEFKASGAIIDYEIGIKPYGVKEFGARDLDDHDIGFGQILQR